MATKLSIISVVGNAGTWRLFVDNDSGVTRNFTVSVPLRTTYHATEISRTYTVTASAGATVPASGAGVISSAITLPPGGWVQIDVVSSLAALGAVAVQQTTVGVTLTEGGVADKQYVRLVQGDKSKLKYNFDSMNEVELRELFFDLTQNDMEYVDWFENNGGRNIAYALDNLGAGGGGGAIPPGTYATPAEVSATTGTANGSTLGTFTGVTISDNVTIKTALQQLETALEASGGGVVAGQYIGTAGTFGTLPTTTVATGAVTAGDWAFLSVDTIGTGTVAAPQYPRGIYIWVGGAGGNYILSVPLGSTSASTLAARTTGGVNTVGLASAYAREDHIHALGVDDWVTAQAYTFGSIVRHTYAGTKIWVRCLTNHTATAFDADSLNWEFLFQQGDVTFGSLAAGVRIYNRMEVVDPDGLRWRSTTSFLKSLTDIANEGATCISSGGTYVVLSSLAHTLAGADKGKPVQYTAGALALGRADASFNSCLGTLVRPIGTTQAIVQALGTMTVPAGLIPVGAVDGDAFWVDPVVPGGYTLTRPSTVGQTAVNVGTYFTGPSRLVVQPISQAA